MKFFDGRTENGIECDKVEMNRTAIRVYNNGVCVLTLSGISDFSEFRVEDADFTETFSEKTMYFSADCTSKSDDVLFELKRLLANSDYISCKIAEGAATKEEYADVIAQRQAWRNEINQLEN